MRVLKCVMRRGAWIVLEAITQLTVTIEAPEHRAAHQARGGGEPALQVLARLRTHVAIFDARAVSVTVLLR